MGRAARARSERGLIGTAAASAVLVLAGCANEGSRIAIDLRTDLAPGLEFSAVRVAGESGAWRREATIAAFQPDDFAAGQRVFEADAPAGTVRVVVQLLSADETVVAERPALVSLGPGWTISTVVLTRDCRGVVCPGPGDPAGAVACHGAVCVDPRCTVETPELCESECEIDADCEPLAPCSSVRCDEGVCLHGAETVRCGLSERCDVELGCVPDTCEGCARTFSTPMVASLIVPSECARAEIQLWGAGGGHVFGAGGGFARATLDLVPGEELIVVVGGPGGHAVDENGGEGGSPGGGGPGGDGSRRGGGGGGGFSGVFRGEISRAGALLIAGGGGGGAAGLPPSTMSAGAGGGASGQDASGTAGARGLGGTQSAGGGGASAGSELQGAPGQGGDEDGGGGGGGGWYGGGGGSDAMIDGQSGGGGSGYAVSAGAILEAGSGSAPGNASAPERAGFGSPGVGGLVRFTCL